MPMSVASSVGLEEVLAVMVSSETGSELRLRLAAATKEIEGEGGSIGGEGAGSSGEDTSGGEGGVGSGVWVELVQHSFEQWLPSYVWDH